MQKIKNFLLVIICTLSINSNAQTTWVTQTYSPDAPGIENNPMKGLYPGYTPIVSNFPYSIDHFYIPLKDTYLNWNTYNWTAFENQLNQITARGCHAIPRFYIDYPKRTYGMPIFLQSIVPYNNYADQDNDSLTQSKSPHWDNETLLTALEQFIAAFGARYDGDPRIVMIEAGLYGFWGEWHNSPNNSWNMSQVNKTRILNAYSNAFKKTHIGLRQPNHAGTYDLAMKFGYYDDSFCYSTLCTAGNWCFWHNATNMGTTENYKTHPMGGEMFPGIQATIFDAWPNTVGEDITTCVNTTHLSFLKAFRPYKQQPTPTQFTNAMKMHKMMGYQFYVRSARITPGNSSNFTVELNIQNRGVAPIYYNWEVEFSAITSSGQWLGTIGTANWNITSILPTSTDFFKLFTGNLPGVDTYKILMRFKNPLDSHATNAKVLRFANAKQDIDKSGWLTLGTVTTTQAPFGGINRNIPGLIESEQYDEGGQGIAFNDNTTKQGILTERPNDNVDISSKTSASNALILSFTLSGEWLEYTVNATTGNYNINLHYYCGSAATGQLKVSLDNTELTTFSGMVNNGWDTRNTLTTNNVNITGGKNKILKLEYVNGAGFNIDAIQFISTSNPQNSKSIHIDNEKINIDLSNTSRIYPNPATRFLHIDSEKNTIKDITIYSMSGQLLYRKSTDAVRMQIDVSSLNVKGMVLVKVNTGLDITIHKILIQ